MILAVSTAAIAWVSEILVGAIEPTAHEFGLNRIFVGVFIVAILGNAAEHATAISAAMKNRMDLSLSIAIGSSVQVALIRGAGAGAGQFVDRSNAHGFIIRHRPCRLYFVIRADYVAGRWRWALRLVKRRATACRVLDSGDGILLCALITSALEGTTLQ